MKGKLLFAMLVMVTGVLFYACQDNQLGDAVKSGDKSARIQACNFVTLSGTLTTQTLSNANTYLISGIVRIPSGVTVTVPAGTLLQGVKSATTAWLVIEKGGKLIASGTSTSPIIFSSDQATGSRAAGDWGGIVFAGNANNNNANSLPIDLSSSYTVTGGGTSNADNSGNLQYVQIHYAGKGYTNDLSRSALVLNSVGSGTMIDHVQVSNSLYDGMATYGGLVKQTYLFSYNAGKTDFPISYGYTGMMQFLSAIRLNNAAIPASSVYALDITNKRTGLSLAMPLTKPVISNVTVLGPNYCSGSTVNANFAYAVRFSSNGAGKIYNSVFSSWRTASAQSGLLIDGAGSIAKTASDDLEFSFNSFHNSGGTPYISNPGTWSASGGCDVTMADWITGSGFGLCIEDGNQFSVATLGYNPSFCSNFCSGFSSNFTLGTTTLASPDYSWDSGSVFSHVSYRGSFGTSDPTTGWTDWCPQNTGYCL